MPVKFEDVVDWSIVPVGEKIVSRAVHADDHVRVYAETTQTWNGANNTVDIGFYAYEKRVVEFHYKLESNPPVFFGPAQPASSSTLVEYGTVKMPVDAAVGLVAGILGILQSFYPQQYAEITTQFGIKPLGQ